MNSKTPQSNAPTPPALIDELVELIVTALPDSLQQRRRLLTALLGVLPENYLHRDHIMMMLHNLDHHDQLQRDLPGLRFRDGKNH